MTDLDPKLQPLCVEIDMTPCIYDDKQWRKIAKSLAPFGIDINAVMVGRSIRPGEPWWELARQRPLKDALQGMARSYRAASTLFPVAKKV